MSSDADYFVRLSEIRGVQKLYENNAAKYTKKQRERVVNLHNDGYV